MWSVLIPKKCRKSRDTVPLNLCCLSQDLPERCAVPAPGDHEGALGGDWPPLLGPSPAPHVRTVPLNKEKGKKSGGSVLFGVVVS